MDRGVSAACAEVMPVVLESAEGTGMPSAGGAPATAAAGVAVPNAKFSDGVAASACAPPEATEPAAAVVLVASAAAPPDELSNALAAAVPCAVTLFCIWSGAGA